LSALLERGIITVELSFRGHLGDTLRFILQYRDTPISFADAFMVRISEQHADSAVFTTDTDFKNCRRNGRQAIPLLAPW
jgi:predicted nucleic acid-binding protein